MQRLVVVEEAYSDGRPGIMLAPRFVLAAPLPGRVIDVRLVLPDGAERAARAEVQVAHARGPLAPYALLRLKDLAPADVPAGTEVWLDAPAPK